MRVKRVFHPVGHGAFYSEEFYEDAKSPQALYRIVYDCGSHDKDIIKHRIKLAFPNKAKIDCVFISHFDSDHVNGLEDLFTCYQVKTVIIPYLTEEEKKLVLFTLLMSETLTPFLRSLLFHSEEDRHDFKVLVVKPHLEDRNDYREDFRDNYFRVDDLTNMAEVYSGSHIRLDSKSEWYFKPFCYNHNKYAPKFKKLVRALSLDYDQLTDPSYVAKHTRDLKKVYHQVMSAINNTSLVLFSGCCLKEGTVLNTTRYVYKGIHSKAKVYLMVDHGCRSVPGCLYMGDIQLNARNRCCQIMQTYCDECRLIGIVQVPHHGAKNVSNVKFWEWIVEHDNINAVISCDGDKYPHIDTILSLTKCGIRYCLATNELEYSVTSYILTRAQLLQICWNAL